MPHYATTNVSTTTWNQVSWHQIFPRATWSHRWSSAVLFLFVFPIILTKPSYSPWTFLPCSGSPFSTFPALYWVHLSSLPSAPPPPPAHPPVLPKARSIIPRTVWFTSTTWYSQNQTPFFPTVSSLGFHFYRWYHHLPNLNVPFNSVFLWQYQYQVI